MRRDVNSCDAECLVERCSRPAGLVPLPLMSLQRSGADFLPFLRAGSAVLARTTLLLGTKTIATAVATRCAASCRFQDFGSRCAKCPSACGVLSLIEFLQRRLATALPTRLWGRMSASSAHDALWAVSIVVKRTPW